MYPQARLSKNIKEQILIMMFRHRIPTIKEKQIPTISDDISNADTHHFKQTENESLIFIYRNYKTKEKQIRIVADCISDADEQYFKQTGNEPLKCPFIGCEVRKNETEDKPTKISIN